MFKLKLACIDWNHSGFQLHMRMHVVVRELVPNWFGSSAAHGFLSALSPLNTTRRLPKYQFFFYYFLKILERAKIFTVRPI